MPKARVFIGCAISIWLGAIYSFAAIETVTPKSSGYLTASWSIPTLLREEEFQLELFRSVFVLINESDVQIGVTQDALGACGLNEGDLRASILSIAASIPKQVEMNLGLSFKNGSSQTNPLRILIDYFPEGSRYGSYFYSNEGSEKGAALMTLGLDCRPASRAQWIPRLAHEWVHLLFKVNHLESESWFEEGIAQWIESKFGGTQPELGLKKLSQETVFPGLFSKERPLISSKNYWAGYAFVKYLQQSWGGQKALIRILSDLKAAKSLDAPLLTRIASSIHSLMAETNPSSLWIEKATRNGLLRFFAAALIVHDPETLALDFPNWSGLQRAVRLPPALLPTQWLVTTLTPQIRETLSHPRREGPEIYEIQVTSAGTQILPYSGDLTPGLEKTLLILNTGTVQIEFITN